MRARTTLLLIVAIAIAARAWLVFSTPWMPGINGAYYLVQARALFERGTLGIPDLPLIFHFHAAFAWALSHIGGIAQDEAILLAVKLTEAFAPALVAVPVFLLVQRWSERSGRLGVMLPAVAAALVCLARPLFGMIGDFQKNELALVWLAIFALALHAWLENATARRGAALLGCTALLALTHVGVLGTALVLTAVVLIVAAGMGGLTIRGRASWLIGAAVVLVAAVSIVLWRFDPARIHRLAIALSNPARFSADGMQMPAPPDSLLAPMRVGSALLFAALNLPALVIVWRSRKSLPVADAAVAAGCALTALALTGPWFSLDKAMRFQLIAIIPTTLSAAFAALRIRSSAVAAAVATAVLVLVVGPTIPLVARGGRAIFADAALRELSSLAPISSNPERVLVCAQHGAEWWAGWLLRTRVVQPQALHDADWSRFSQVLFLEMKSPMQLPFGPPGGMGRTPSGRPFPPPPIPMARIPADAQIIHAGEHLRLARVASPPVGPRLLPPPPVP